MDSFHKLAGLTFGFASVMAFVSMCSAVVQLAPGPVPVTDAISLEKIVRIYMYSRGYVHKTICQTIISIF